MVVTMAEERNAGVSNNWYTCWASSETLLPSGRVVEAFKLYAGDGERRHAYLLNTASNRHEKRSGSKTWRQCGGSKLRHEEKSARGVARGVGVLIKQCSGATAKPAAPGGMTVGRQPVENGEKGQLPWWR